MEGEKGDDDDDGWNYTERRAQTPTLCTFYNSDFLIYSSMGSFYIPCLVMVLLYWRIFHTIRQRTRKSVAAAAATSASHAAAHRKSTPTTCDIKPEATRDGRKSMPALTSTAEIENTAAVSELIVAAGSDGAEPEMEGSDEAEPDVEKKPETGLPT